MQRPGPRNGLRLYFYHTFSIGQAGRGNSLEIGQLALDHDENFCMGGPGVILSRETLRRVAPHIHKCLDNLVTSHEDVELGRCVRRFAGIQCTWSYEVIKTFISFSKLGQDLRTINFKNIMSLMTKNHVFIRNCS